MKEESGYCPVCEQPTVFQASNEWLRDYYSCKRCGSIPRQRALHYILATHFPQWQSLSIHESSPSNTYLMQQAILYSASQYFPGHPTGENIQGIRNENLEKLTFPDETFDLFITQDVLEHVFHPQSAIQEMFRVVRPGGALVFTVPIHKQAKTVPRVDIQDGEVVYLRKAEYHGNPVGDGKSLVTYDYGDDFVALAESAVPAVCERINRSIPELGIEGEYLDVFVIRKKKHPDGKAVQPLSVKEYLEKVTGANQLARGSSPRQRLEFLDALRGLAALYVVIYHMIMIPQPHLVPPLWADKVASAGGTGVTLFFIVSAFSLYFTMPRRMKEKNPILSFYLHRFFRIAPLFYLLIVFTLVRDAWRFGVLHGPGEISASLTFIFNMIPTKQEGFVWAGWTIGVEMIFYAMFPFIYRRIKTAGNAVAFFFGCLLLWQFIQLMLDYAPLPQDWKQSVLQWSTFKHFPVFAMGIVLFHLYSALHDTKQEPGRHQSYGNALLLGGLFAYAALLHGWLPSVFGDMYYWQAVIYGSLFFGLSLSPWRLVVNAITSYLGKISYSVYLIHPTVVFFLTPVYRWLYLDSPSLTMSFLASLLMTLSIVLPFSALTYRLIEAPGISLGKNVATRLQARGKLAPETAT